MLTLVDKLNQLYKQYAPDMSTVPTSDQILSGLLAVPENLTFDQHWLLMQHCTQAVLHAHEHCAQPNVIVAEKIQELVGYWRVAPVELSMYSIQLLTLAGVIAAYLPSGRVTALNEFASMIQDISLCE